MQIIKENNGTRYQKKKQNLLSPFTPANKKNKMLLLHYVIIGTELIKGRVMRKEANCIVLSFNIDYLASRKNI